MDGTFRRAVVPDDIYDAITCVTSVFDAALTSGKHEPGDWRKLTEVELWQKFDMHYQFSSDTEDDLANLCCRALMLLQLREESKLKGPKG